MSGQEKRNHVSVRLDSEVIGRIDTMIPRFSTQQRGGTRSDVVRALILAGLEIQAGTESAETPAHDQAGGRSTRGDQ
jgi:metal-responsive CopG/Arc/MetJ family transcriptional regulator